ncbi:hypothetical protein O6H91_08G059800 [Diphasiastrum complanatum]|uniref:Uncharacterized protein n=1 Tax=Diphasiastrum complanatum TaxID=34168 RepID=A0ACC2CY15_DIPCM|nr:hypothetical protein O6H91_08G059800 [Diphasiastrum complanatum]
MVRKETVMNMVVQAAMETAVLVRIHGPDPKRRKMRQHAFYHTESGDTTLSSSGLIVLRNTPPIEEFEKFCSFHGHHELIGDLDSSALVITCASTVEPFLLPKLHPGGGKVQASPRLIAGAELDVLIKVPQKASEEVGSSQTYWSPAQLLTLVDIPEAGEALGALLDAHTGNIDSTWEVGWALAKADSNRQLHGFNTQAVTDMGLMENEIPHSGADSSKGTALEGLVQSGSLARAATRIALLIVRLQDSKMNNPLVLAEPSKRGDFLLHVGSPFGALSPLHFFNSVSVGIVSNCWPPASSLMSLLMADVRCLPGMEGGPVFNDNGSFVGILIRPLRQRSGGAEIQLVITSHALVHALENIGILLGVPHLKENAVSHLQQKGAFSQLIKGNQLVSSAFEVQGTLQPFSLGSSVLLAVQKAVASVVLVTVGDGAWASGIILNKGGLILTNAHLLEPWRFGKSKLSQIAEEHTFNDCSFCNKAHGHPNGRTCSDANQVPANQRGLSQMKEIDNELIFRQISDGLSNTASPNLGRLYESATDSAFTFGPTAKWNRYDRIRVRLDHCFPNSWCDARALYISQGPLDIALLQLTLVPENLLPITPEKASPALGSVAVVLGYGLFGPRSELCSSATAGVVSRVVKVGFDTSSNEEIPAMLETTAAVHPGGSGGAVINEQGHLIGLVTRHSGGTVIPYLNFSIPCTILEPVLDCASKEKNEWSFLQQIDKPNEALSAVWALVPPTPPRPSQKIQMYLTPPPSTDIQKPSEPDISKGSKFAKFLSDRQSILGLKQMEPRKENWYIEDQQRLVHSSRASSASVLQSRL